VEQCSSAARATDLLGTGVVKAVDPKDGTMREPAADRLAENPAGQVADRAATAAGAVDCRRRPA
jgi:hypothetical protein